MKDFHILDRLGDGTFGQVYRARRITDGMEYALKKVDTRALNDKQIHNALNQVRILASIDDPNIIGYKDAFYQPQYECLCLVMELADGGDLQTLIRKRAKSKSPVVEADVWKVAYDILKGMKALHKHKIIHRDIKSANIFISKGVAKLGDMNVSKITKTQYAYSQAGTPYYSSPEIFKNQPYSYESDVWSFGCVIYQMCMFKVPFKTSGTLQDLSRKVIKGSYQPVSAFYSLQLRRFIESCLVVDPFDRANIGCLMQQACLHISVDMSISVQRGNLLQSMQVPKNLNKLNKILPKPRYEKQSSRQQLSLNIIRRKDTNSREEVSVRKKQESDRKYSVKPATSLKCIQLSAKSAKYLKQKSGSQRKLKKYQVNSDQIADMLKQMGNRVDQRLSSRRQPISNRYH